MTLSMIETFFELLQISVGRRDRLTSAPSSEEWRMLLNIAKEQAVVGVCRVALEKLPKCQWPPRMIILEWSAVCRKIELNNGKLNKAAVAVSKWFGREGFCSCILKGQGNALMYPDHAMRMPGDIDIWIDGGSRRVISFARKNGIRGKAYYHHIEWEPYGDVEVEVHYRPSFMFNPVNNCRLQKWFRQNSAVQFSNAVDLPDGTGSIAVPVFEFNVVFQLAHLSNHFFHEGIGLRQFVDYYFLLRGNKDCVSSLMFKSGLEERLSHFGLRNFAGAVMWVLGRVFLLEREYMITAPDKKRGLLLLAEIMEGGNFGKYDKRVLSGVQTGFIRHNLARLYRDVRLCRLFPSECLWEPCFRCWHIIWRYFH